MKKVLIISYEFNQREVIGSVRLRGLAKYLPKFDWDPVVLCVGLSKNTNKNHPFRVIEVPHELPSVKWKRFLKLDEGKTLKEQMPSHNSEKKENYIDTILKLRTEFFSFPDEKRSWIKPATNAIDEFISEEKIDAIISSSMPLTSHLIAYKLKKKHDIPWIADLRDLWSQNHYHNFSRLRKYRDIRLEKATLSRADVLTTVTRLFKEQLTEIHDKRKIFVIPNGFDPDLVNPSLHLTDKFSITYTGNLYQGKRDPTILFKALNELNDEKKIDLHSFEVNFYGHKEGWLSHEVRIYGLQDTVKFHGSIPREDVIKKQRESQLLLLLTWINPNEFSTVPGKIFEYFAARRPILSYGMSGSCVEELIKKTSSGIHINDLKEMKTFIFDKYSEYESKGKLDYMGNINEINKYTHLKMAKKFSDVLNSILKVDS